MADNAKHKPGYKKTALGWIPEEWNLSCLASMGKMTSGGTPSKADPKYWYGDIPWFSAKDLKTFDLGDSEDMITHVAVKDGAKIVPANTILILVRGMMLNRDLPIGVTSKPSSFNQDLKAITTYENVDTRFAAYALVGMKGRLLSLIDRSSHGTGIMETETLQNFPIPLPPLPEQHAIAKVLGCWDKAIGLLSALIAQKQARKKWLMQMLLSGKRRLPGFEGEWRSVRLGDVFDRVTRKNQEGNTTVVTISAQRGFVLQTDFFNKTIASDSLEGYFLVERGEFCYNKSYSKGYDWGATKRLKDFDKAVVTTLYICFRLTDELNYSPDFFEWYFEENLLDKGLSMIAHEGGRAHGLLNVTPSDFFDLEISAPKIEEQRAIARVAGAATMEIALLESQLAALKEQKKGLMQELLTGRKRLNHD